jgi:hypothetical protein
VPRIPRIIGRTSRGVLRGFDLKKSFSSHRIWNDVLYACDSIHAFISRSERMCFSSVVNSSGPRPDAPMCPQ